MFRTGLMLIGLGAKVGLAGFVIGALVDVLSAGTTMGAGTTAGLVIGGVVGGLIALGGLALCGTAMVMGYREMMRENKNEDRPESERSRQRQYDHNQKPSNRSNNPSERKDSNSKFTVGRLEQQYLKAQQKADSSKRVVAPQDEKLVARYSYS